ncbi:dockerin type I domain-containing protein [uncultured Ruminococcus sp.]|uniref:dockerin type I domain-containing protein n=1 Tax=uncultured Ruminococcus sp. TaxID=165186 RepID=UPI00266D4AFD|nr:dockerin type I domain-containing protein [uncultured Ruminococcus sp.]
MKKSLACLIASILAIASLPVSAGAAEFDPFPPGDVDRDTVITGHDAALVSRYVLLGDNRLTDKQLKLADINQDGVVDQTDADLIHQQAVYLLGDVTLDGVVDVDDGFDTAQEYAYYAALLRNSDYTLPMFSKLQENLADMDGLQDGTPDLDDAMTILQYYCIYAAGCLSNTQAAYGSGVFYITKNGAPCYFFDPADYIQNGPGKGF